MAKRMMTSQKVLLNKQLIKIRKMIIKMMAERMYCQQKKMTTIRIPPRSNNQTKISNKISKETPREVKTNRQTLRNKMIRIRIAHQTTKIKV